ncbi:MAG: MFS transporter [Halieaceae bacterium]|nr:MFS transporter [Halieaceae bacterium]
MFPVELATLGAAATFFSYVLFALIALGLIIKLLPETKGRSLEALEEIFTTPHNH